jgi:hypothetical protein
MQVSLNQAAFATVSLTAAATIGCALQAAVATTVVAKVAYIGLSILCGTANIASLTSYAATKDSDTAGDYLETMKDHLAKGVPAVISVVAQALMQALIQGLVEGVRDAIRRAISGPDVVVEQRNVNQKI